jgi:hypothetical protein
VQASSSDAQYGGSYLERKITVSMKWVKDGDTTVTIVSNLDRGQFDYVAAAVQKAVDGEKATTEPGK